ncbi:MGMT family protein [Fusibacter sp. JL216-2]|uniref:MGMT family protein n=1 Tax=Fusibacter sp. JL216-2 TaxID=3071453 RepID=UPI003D343F4E
MLSEFTVNVIKIIQSIPQGRVATYGQIATLSGHPRAPRQVAGILKRYSNQYELPWHRVISSKGTISIKDPLARREQMERLREENVLVGASGEVDLTLFGWRAQSFETSHQGKD